MAARRSLLALLGLGALALPGCGDVGTVKLAVDFADPSVALRTRALQVVVREPPEAGDGCAALWSDAPTGLAESRAVVEYPSPHDVLATPVKLTLYPRLTFLVYAHAGLDVTAEAPLAGGCVTAAVGGDDVFDVALRLEAP
jgi:hypothetical protein